MHQKVQKARNYIHMAFNESLGTMSIGIERDLLQRTFGYYITAMRFQEC